MNRDVILKAIKAKYPKGMRRRDAANMLWTFYHEIKPGDFVIARRGQMILAAIGKVIKTAKYDAEKHSLYGISEVTYPYFWKSNGRKSPAIGTIADRVFPRPTIRELSKCKGLSEDQRRTIRSECLEYGH